MASLNQLLDMESCDFAGHLCFHSNVVSYRQFKTWKQLKSWFLQTYDSLHAVMKQRSYGVMINSHIY